MVYFLDKIIIPTLKVNTTKFKSFLEVMKESGDEKFISMAEKLGTYSYVHTPLYICIYT